MSSQFQCKSDEALAILCLSALVSMSYSSTKLHGNIYAGWTVGKNVLRMHLDVLIHSIL